MVAARYGWTFDYITKQVAWINIRMMMADSIKTKPAKPADNTEEMTDDEMLKLNED